MVEGVDHKIEAVLGRVEVQSRERVDSGGEGRWVEECCIGGRLKRNILGWPTVCSSEVCKWISVGVDAPVAGPHTYDVEERKLGEMGIDVVIHIHAVSESENPEWPGTTSFWSIIDPEQGASECLDGVGGEGCRAGIKSEE